MLTLRCFMIGASSFSIAYNLLQPTPLLAPAGWGFFFVCGHLVQISRILRDRVQVQMTEDAADLYESAFHPHGFLPRQFMKIMALGHVEWLGGGTTIAAIGEEASDIVLVWRGTAAVSDRSGTLVGHLGQHRWIGNMVPHSKEHHNAWKYEIRTESSCRVIRWHRSDLESMFREDQTLSECAASLIASDLSRKLSDSAFEHALHEYRSMLEVAIADGRLVAEEKQQLREYRRTHGLSAVDHSACLAQLGWSDQEYDDGLKHSHLMQPGRLSRLSNLLRGKTDCGAC